MENPPEAVDDSTTLRFTGYIAWLTPTSL
jgi:hypothetical protein